MAEFELGTLGLGTLRLACQPLTHNADLDYASLLCSTG